MKADVTILADARKVLIYAAKGSRVAVLQCCSGRGGTASSKRAARLMDNLSNYDVAFLNSVVGGAWASSGSGGFESGRLCVNPSCERIKWRSDS